METDFIKTVARRYGLEVGKKLAEGEIRERRKQLGEKELRKLRKELRKWEEKLFSGDPIYNRDVLVDRVKGLRQQVKALSDFISEATEPEKARAQRFRDLVKDLDKEIVEKLKEMGEYIEITTLPEEEEIPEERVILALPSPATTGVQ